MQNLKSHNPDTCEIERGQLPSFSLPQDEWFNSHELQRMEMRTSNQITSYYEMPDIQMAFSKNVRMEIGERDDWTCQHTGRRFDEGWMVHACHYDHDKIQPHYNDVSNGRILCVEEHLIEHINIFQDRRDRWSVDSLRTLARAAYNQGLRTYRFYNTHPFARGRDRRRVIKILNDYGLDARMILGI